MEAASTGDCFARLLVFYDAVKRSKLNEADLSKIVAKYRSRPTDMLADLQKKYTHTHHFPPTVLLADIQRLTHSHTHTLPSCLLDLLPPLDHLPPYDPRLDIRSTEFDPAVALLPSKVGLLLPCAPLPGVPVLRKLDNLSKAGTLLPHATATATTTATTTATRKGESVRVGGERESSKDMKQQRECAKDARVVVKPLDRIALASSKHKVPRQDITNESEGVSEGGGHRSPFVWEDSPLVLLYTAMQQRRRVRVIVRHVNSIRGTIDGYVRGFDKHFNLLLTDVDERYTPPTPVRIPGPAARHSSLHKDRHPRNDEDTLVRHLPQLLVRGDNVVLVCYRDKQKAGVRSPSTSSSSKS